MIAPANSPQFRARIPLPRLTFGTPNGKSIPVPAHKAGMRVRSRNRIMPTRRAHGSFRARFSMVGGVGGLLPTGSAWSTGLLTRRSPATRLEAVGRVHQRTMPMSLSDSGADLLRPCDTTTEIHYALSERAELGLRFGETEGRDAT